VRVAIAEDSVLLREGLARLLGEAGFDVVGQCVTADDLMLKVRSYSPDVVIVDIRLPPTHSDEGRRAALEIRATRPSIGVLVLSQYVELGLALKLLADSAEGVGYLLKDRISDVDDFLAAVRRVADGGSALDPLIVSALISRQRADDSLAHDRARARGARADGHRQPNQGIADKLVITVRRREVRLEHRCSSDCRRAGASRAALAVLSSCSPAEPETPENRPSTASPLSAAPKGCHVQP
jgi:DNA-binding NarL/FixJ family response regulator